MDEYKIAYNKELDRCALLKNGKVFIDYIYRVLRYVKFDNRDWIFAFEDIESKIPIFGMNIQKHMRMYPVRVVKQDKVGCTITLDIQPPTMEELINDIMDAEEGL